MRKLLLLTVFITPLFLGCSQNKSNAVFVCTGPSSHVYHSNSDCKGLNRCSGNIEKISLSEAKDMGRRPCKICY